MPLLIHGEVTDPDVDIFDREAVFIERSLNRIVRDFSVPEKWCWKQHYDPGGARSSWKAIPVPSRRPITAHHLVINRKRHVSKEESGRTVIVCRSPSGKSTGLNCAARPHRARPSSSSERTRPRIPSAKKKTDCGCAGIFSAPTAMELYARVFDEEGALENLENVCEPRGGRIFMAWSLMTSKITLARGETVTAPAKSISAGSRPSGLSAPGRTLNWENQGTRGDRNGRYLQGADAASGRRWQDRHIGDRRRRRG